VPGGCSFHKRFCRTHEYILSLIQVKDNVTTQWWKTEVRPPFLPSSFSVHSDVFLLLVRVLDPCSISVLVLIPIIILILSFVPVLFVYSGFDLVE
jgi:hypothetical protein